MGSTYPPTLRLLLLNLCSGWCVGFLQEGYEYTYRETGIQNVGTMDVSPSAAGLSYRSKTTFKVGSNRILVKVTDIESTQYVGDYPLDDSAYKNTTYVGYGSGVSYSYAINYKDGQVESIDIPSGVDRQTRNGIKAAVANLQLSTLSITKSYFETTEKLLHGDCKVHYVAAPGLVTRSVMHQQDCLDRPYREVDNWRGWRCDGHYLNEAVKTKDGAYMPGRSDPNPGISKSDAYYQMEERPGGLRVVKEMGVEAAIGEQMFESAGAAQFVVNRRKLELVDVKRSGGGLGVPGGSVTHTDLTFEFDDAKYGWNTDRNLKDREDMFSIGNTAYDAPSVYGATVAARLDQLVSNFDISDHSAESVAKLHQAGAHSILPLMYAMDYDSLNTLLGAFDVSSAAGKIKRNIYKELLVSTGTSAAAMLIKDLILKGATDGEADSMRMLTGIPFHVRRPNTQLVREIESLKNRNLGAKVDEALPLVIAHLVRRTCELGVPKAYTSLEFHNCLAKFSDGYADKYYKKLVEATDDKARFEAVFFLTNLRWGKVSQLLQKYLARPGPDHVQAEAVHAAMYGTFLDESTSAAFMPIFMNQLLGPETRMMALQVFTYGQFDLTQLSTIVSALYMEGNYEVTNYGYTLLDSIANSINPCLAKKADMIKFFSKLMKQYALHRMQYTFGISKYYTQEYLSDKYGYGSTNKITVVGTDKDYTPLKVGLEVANTLYKGYMTPVGSVQLRIEGLARAAQRKLLNKMPEKVWRLEELATTLSDMGVDLMSDPNIRLQAIICLKGTVVMTTLYEKDPNSVGGYKITDLLKLVMGKSGGKPAYDVSFQRAVNFGVSLYEQPNEFGMLSYSARAITTIGSLVGKVKKGVSKGALTRSLDFNLNLQTYSINVMGFVENQNSKLKFELVTDRFLTLHMPRSLFGAVNVGKKILTVRVKRPDTDDPVQVLMHSLTVVKIEALKLNGATGTSRFCPACKDVHVISAGREKSKVFADTNDKDLGSLAKGEYFDCEYDISDANVGGNAVFLFHPQNKSPKTFMTSMIMGLRQARHFLVYFPRAEKCGAYMKWSKSPTDPVHEIEVVTTVKTKDKGTAYFYTGKEFYLKVDISLLGDQGKDREFVFSFKYTASPGFIQNSVVAQFWRKANSVLGLSDYSICFMAKNKYPGFTDDLNGGDLDEHLKLNGQMILKYGEANVCKRAPGSITINFQHETTAEAKAHLRTTPAYKACMDQKRLAEWRNRRGLPYTRQCYLAAYDASLARKYHWDVTFQSISPEVRAWYEKATTVFKTAVLPYWDLDPNALSRSLDSPKLELDILFKDGDSSADVRLKTDKGVSDMKDMPTDFPVFGGPLRSLRFDNTRSSLVNRQIVDFCTVTSAQISTMDNKTVPYSPESCWTLVSGHCSVSPSYAVFTKKASGLPLATKAFVGGHEVLMQPQSATRITVQVGGNTVNVANGDTYTHKAGKTVIFKLTNWSGTYILNSDSNFSLVYDGNFVQVLPMMGTIGQHCGACGNFDGNSKNDLTDKKGVIVQADQLARAWC